MIQYHCPRCGRHRVLPDSFAGQSQLCSGCGNLFQLEPKHGSDLIQQLPSSGSGPQAAEPPVLEVELEPLEPVETLPTRLPDFPPGLSLEIGAGDDWEDIPELPLATPVPELPLATPVLPVASPIPRALPAPQPPQPTPTSTPPLRWYRGAHSANANSPALATIYVDNFSSRGLRLQLNGLPWRTVLPGSSTTTVLRRGSYILMVLALDTDDELERHALEVVGGTHYVLNGLRAQVYTSGVAYYGPANESVAAPVETPVTEAWFQAHEEYLFQEPPPSLAVQALNLTNGPGHGHLRTYLRRGAPCPQKDQL